MLADQGVYPQLVLAKYEGSAVFREQVQETMDQAVKVLER